MIVLRNPKDGTMVCVENGNGYPGWEAVESRAEHPPEFARWIEGQGWVVDQDEADAAAEEARLNSLSRGEFFREVQTATTVEAQGARTNG